MPPEHMHTVVTVYVSAVLPTLVVIWAYLTHRMPRWLFVLWLISLALCVFGWELWLTYGLVDGQDVNARRPAALAAAIPMHINWLLNSLADASSIGLFGVLLIWLCYGRGDRAFRQWRWGAFVILLVWFVGQNLWVELFIYQQQLAEGFRLSWAPLIPTGPWFNPVLFDIGGRSVQLQTQLPWVLMTPIYYWLLIRIYNHFDTTAPAA
ncbi:MAG: hypothetical protein Hals2KO_31240 [Halioglobus sp.]